MLKIDDWHGAVAKQCDELIATLTDDEITLLQRDLRGTSAISWRSWRAENLAHIADFIRLSPAARVQQHPELATRAVLKLAGWQLLSEIASFLDQIRSLEESGTQPPMQIDSWLAAASVLALGVSQRHCALWPFELGSPFRE